jgi:hypothetical protein
MSFPSGTPASTKPTEEVNIPTQNVVQKKLPYSPPQIGPLHHISQVTGEKGSSKEYDSYNDNRP